MKLESVDDATAKAISLRTGLVLRRMCRLLGAAGFMQLKPQAHEDWYVWTFTRRGRRITIEGWDGTERPRSILVFRDTHATSQAMRCPNPATVTVAQHNSFCGLKLDYLMLLLHSPRPPQLTLGRRYPRRRKTG